MYKEIEEYKKNGYKEIENTSCISSVVLYNLEKDKVVKFGQDSAYDLFISFVDKQPKPLLPGFPVVYKHTKPAGDFSFQSNSAYTVCK